MYTSCFEKVKEIGECSNDFNSFNSELIEKNITFNSNEAFLNKPKKIPIKIILSENEEVLSTKNNSEQLDNTASLDNSPSQIPNLTENFIKFSNSNTSNIIIGNYIFRFFKDLSEFSFKFF